MTPQEWVDFLLRVGLAAAAAVGVVWRMVKQPLEERLKTQGERIGAVEGKQEACATAIALAEKRDLEHDFRIGALNQQIGKLEGLYEKYETQHSRDAEMRRQENLLIIDRLGRIETRLEIFEELKQIAQQLINSKRDPHV